MLNMGWPRRTLRFAQGKLVRLIRASAWRPPLGASSHQICIRSRQHATFVASVLHAWANPFPIADTANELRSSILEGRGLVCEQYTSLGRLGLSLFATGATLLNDIVAMNPGEPSLLSPAEEPDVYSRL